MALHSIECFAGVGMLGVGLRAGLAHLGIETRTVCYVEREAFAASVMAARMAEGALDDAPVWSDVCTFDARAWRGAVDCVIGGFPCQDLSLAGRRAGLDGKRSGLFFELLRIAEDSGARYLFLENVGGIASATASVVDEAEGALDERAAARVMGELADRGWNAEWLTLSASDVGASHGRARWFCWAWRSMADSPSRHRGELARADQRGLSKPDGGAADGANVDDPERAERRAPCSAGTCSQQRDDGGRHEAHGGIGESDEVLGHAQSQRFRETRRRGAPAPYAGTGGAGAGMADTERHGRHQGRPEPGREQGRPDASECGCAVADSDDREHDEQPGEVWPRDIGAKSRRREVRAGGHCEHVADASSPRQQGPELGTARSGNRGGQEAHGPTEQLRRPLFAPGPADAAWPDILARWPWLAPAIAGESGSSRLNPCFVEFLMGWPIFWTYINGDKTSDQKASAARSTNEWRTLLQMRLSEWFDAPSLGLQQAAGGGDHVPVLPCDTSCGRNEAETSGLQDLQGTVHANPHKALSHLSETGMQSGQGGGGCREAMGQQATDGSMQLLPGGVHENAATPNNVQQIVREQVGMEEQAMSNRAARLKCCGNGVVPLQAAVALVELVRRAAGR